MRLFSTIATFGTAIDITLAELSIETLYPADDATAAVLATRPWPAETTDSPTAGPTVATME